MGGGYAQSGLGLGPSLILLCVDYAKLLNTGTDAMIRQAEDEMAKLRFLGSKETIEKFRYYQGVISSLRAMNILAERYAALAARMWEFPHVALKGLMAIPPVSEFPGENCRYFAEMRNLFVDIKAKKYDNVSMECLSMGMSDDYTDAIAEGSTMVRIGTAIFGERHY